jgi:hypothetical protein
MFPPEFLGYFRTGGRLGLEWLDTVTKRTKSFLKQLPKEAGPGAPAVRRRVARRRHAGTRSTRARKRRS